MQHVNLAVGIGARNLTVKDQILFMYTHTHIHTYMLGLGDIESVTCNYCINYLLRLLQYCVQKFEAQPHSLKSLQCQYETWLVLVCVNCMK